MCAVVGYIGRRNGKEVIKDGLSKLEYRGYDSAGLAYLNDKTQCLDFIRSKGELKLFFEKLDNFDSDGNIAIGHTRWATHGRPSEKNSHPQFDCKKSVFVVHNGIIENFYKLKSDLEKKGHKFLSETDTEVVSHLLEEFLDTEKKLKGSLQKLVNYVDGSYSFICILKNYKDRIVLVRKGSSLCIGIGKNEMFVSSDPLAFSDKTKKVVFLPNNSFAILKKDLIELYDFDGQLLQFKVNTIDTEWSVNSKGSHKHYMIKEIYEQKDVISKTISYYRKENVLDLASLTDKQLNKTKVITLIGSGTSWHAARISQFFFENICKIPTRVFLSSEFVYMPFFKETDSLNIVVSQSGETADTLEAVRLMTSNQAKVIVLTNVKSSTMIRESDGFLLTHAGPEVSVASTKAFSTQLSVLYWFANKIALEKKIITSDNMFEAENNLFFVAKLMEESIEYYKTEICNKFSKWYREFDRFIFLGRHISYPFAMEAALKLKEISYSFSQCYPAGELKHGPIALVDKQTPVFIFSNVDELIYKKLLSNAQEVKSRSGHITSFSFEGQKELQDLSDINFIFPKVEKLLSPLVMTGVMQFLTYQIALMKNLPIDKPRNLAKTVTVE